MINVEKPRHAKPITTDIGPLRSPSTITGTATGTNRKIPANRCCSGPSPRNHHPSMSMTRAHRMPANSVPAIAKPKPNGWPIQITAMNSKSATTQQAPIAMNARRGNRGTTRSSCGATAVDSGCIASSLVRAGANGHWSYRGTEPQARKQTCERGASTAAKRLVRPKPTIRNPKSEILNPRS
jgi:hypothetical protein